MSDFYPLASETGEETPRKKFSPLAVVAAVQAIFVTVIIVTLLIVKLMFPPLFADIKKNYKERFFQKTDIAEVLGNESEESVVNGDEV